MKPYERLYNLKSDEQDRIAWLNGMYVYKAINVILYNSFKSNGSKDEKYPDKPISSQEQTRELTKEEIYAMPDDEREQVLMQAIESAMASTIDGFNRKKETEDK